jgi:hypothetical protein
MNCCWPPMTIVTDSSGNIWMEIRTFPGTMVAVGKTADDGVGVAVGAMVGVAVGVGDAAGVGDEAGQAVTMAANASTRARAAPWLIRRRKLVLIINLLLVILLLRLSSAHAA